MGRRMGRQKRGRERFELCGYGYGCCGCSGELEMEASAGLDDE